MRTIAMVACVLVVGCSGADAKGSTTPRTVADPQIITLRSQLIQGLVAQHCGLTPGASATCRNLSVPCAIVFPATPAQRANGVARYITFHDSYIYREGDAAGSPKGPWRDGSDSITIEDHTDGTAKYRISAPIGYGELCSLGVEPQGKTLVRF
jgi:hypothetical protein